MKRALILTLVVAGLAVSAAGAATSPQALNTANHDCTLLKAKMGTTFTTAYPSFGKCVSAYAPVEQANITSAQSACSAEQSDANFAATHGGKTFDQFYGTGKSGKNALGRCVSRKTQTSTQAEQQGRLNPAQTCRKQRTDMTADVFTKTYGTNGNKQNAFGKCVAKAAHAQSANEVNAAQTCSAAQDADATAFATKYGTNADKSNAFGNCVSQTAQQTTQTQVEATISAAKACASELKADAAAFKSKYGTFGHCVSQKASTK
jgi:hypothetical protein